MHCFNCECFSHSSPAILILTFSITSLPTISFLKISLYLSPIFPTSLRNMAFYKFRSTSTLVPGHQICWVSEWVSEYAVILQQCRPWKKGNFTQRGWGWCPNFECMHSAQKMCDTTLDDEHNCNIIECYNNTHQGMPYISKQTCACTLDLGMLVALLVCILIDWLVGCLLFRTVSSFPMWAKLVDFQLYSWLMYLQNLHIRNAHNFHVLTIGVNWCWWLILCNIVKLCFCARYTVFCCGRNLVVCEMCSG